MSRYQHLTPHERETLYLLHASEKSLREIARQLHRSASTLSRELARNVAEDSSYSPSDAQEKYHEHRQRSRRHKRLEDSAVRSYVEEKLFDHQWSPEEIEGRLKLEGKASVSYRTIYRGIYSGLLDHAAHVRGGKRAVRALRHHGKRRHTKEMEERRGKIRISHDISERPKSAEERSRLGHWEADTVAGRQKGACIVTLVDRKSRYLLGDKAVAKKAVPVGDLIAKLLEEEPLLSITPDRGKEFADHEAVSESLGGVKFYFPPPHQPWQRGTNENTNGLLREYLPKGTDLTNIPDSYIQQKIDEINKRPRKCLGYKTPYEVYHSKVLHLA